MPDAADDSCIHLVQSLERNEIGRCVEYRCLDCGRPFATLGDSVIASGGVETWLLRSGIPESKIASARRRGIIPPLEVTP